MTQYTDRTGNRKAKAGSTSPDFANHHVLQFVCAVWLSFAVCEAAYSTGSVRQGGRGRARGRASLEVLETTLNFDRVRIADDVRARDTVSQLHLGYIARARPPPWENKTGKRN